MRNSKHALKRLAIALGALLLVSAVALAQVTVGLPTVTAKVNTTQSIPMTVSDLTGKGVISYSFKVTYDATNLNVTGITTGPLVAAWAAPTVNTTVPGQVTVAGAGTSNLSGSGTLVYLIVTTIGKGTYPLTFSQFQLNDTISVTKTNGLVIVPTLSVKISDITTAVVAPGTFTLPITTEDMTGLNATSYQFTVLFDPTKITLTGATTAGTMSASFANPVVNTTVGGKLSVAVAGSTALAGAGVLINLTGTVVGAAPATTAVTFQSFQYNDGTPAGGGVDGSVSLGINQKPVFVSRTPATLTTLGQNKQQTFVVSARDPEGLALSYTWKVSGLVVKGPSADSTYIASFADAHGTAKVVTAIFTDVGGLKDSSVWNFTITGIQNTGGIPTDFVLGQNYPNPFNPTTLISFSLPKEAPVTFEVYNMLGVKIRTLMAGENRSAGTYTISWDGRNDAGVGMPSGVYLYRVLAGSYVASKKMTLLK